MMDSMLSREETRSISISTGTMVRAVLVFLGVLLFWVLRDLVLIILTSIFISSFIDSAVPHFKKIGINRIFGIIIIYVFSLSILAGLFYFFAPLLITEIYNFASYMSTYVPGITFLEYFRNEAFSGAREIVAELPANLSFGELFAVSKTFILNLSGGFFQTLSVAFGGIINVGLIILISFYLSIEEKGIQNFLRIILPLRYEDYAIGLWERTSKKIALWMKGQILLGILIAVLTYLMLSLLGIHYALLLAIIAGIMELVPYGILVALVPAVAFSYISGGIPIALVVTGAYVILHEFEVFLFSPLIIKNVVGLSPIVIILAAVIGYELGSFWGALLAIPSALFLVELMSDLEKHKAFSRTQNEKR